MTAFQPRFTGVAPERKIPADTLSHWIVAALFIAIVPFVACLGE